MEPANPLIGKTLAAVKVSKDRESILFVLEGEPAIQATAWGDCCSRTWIEGVEVPTLPAVVVSVEDIEMPSVTPEGGKYGGDTDEVKFYGLRITLSTGHLVIDYRNDSNGYYGGELAWPGEYSHKPAPVDPAEWGDPC